jgi:small-conductance mechanosensitive channel
MSETWIRAAIAAVVLVAAFGVARLVDRRIGRRDLEPGAATRYRVLRRTIETSVVFIGILSALLVIPQVRAVAGAILASSAVIGLILGFAAQRTIGNFIAGLLIAFTQPVRLGDEVELDGTRGVVEEIGLTYTWVRTHDDDRLVIPNEKLASETIRNSTIRSARTLAEVTVHVPLSADLRAVVSALGQESAEAYVTDLGEDATIAVRTWVANERLVDRAASDLRLTIHERLRELGLLTPAVA